MFTLMWDYYSLMTRSQLMGTYLSHPVTKNLTLHRMSKIEFQPDFRNPQMLSFLNMYNTMGSGRFGRESTFSLKKCLKNSVLGGKIF